MFKRSVQTYLGNPNLRACGVGVEYTQQQLEELEKCMKDPMYFIDNYVKVVSSMNGGGVHLLKLLPYQRKIVESFHRNRDTIVLSGRQIGKCVSLNTLVTIRNKEYNNGNPYTIKIGELYEWLKFQVWGQSILEGSVRPSRDD